MAFGFSLGDFLALGNLILSVGRSLRDASGSASQYRELQHELDGLQRALKCVYLSSPQNESTPLVAEIRQAVMMCRVPLQEFLDKVQGYEGSLGAGKSQGKLVDWGKRAQWMMGKKEEEVGRLRAVLGVHVGSINMMLARQGVEMLESAAREAGARHRSLQGRLEESQTAITAVGDALSEQWLILHDNASLLKQLLTAVTHLAAWFWRAEPIPSPDIHHAWFQPPVKLEDGLGRVIPVASEYDFGLVAALVRERFKAGPGARLVEGGKYELFNTKQSGFPITPENWTAFLPGAHVKMAFVLEKRFKEEEGCPMPRCGSRTFTEAVGGGRVCAECNVWFTKPKHTPQARVVGRLSHPQYFFDDLKLKILKAIISGEVGKTYKEPELQIGPAPLDSTIAAEESKEDAGADEETALFRNLKLREAPTGSSLQLFSPRWNRYLPQYDPIIEKVIGVTTLKEVEAIRRVLSTASEIQKEQWHQQSVDPLALYFRELAAGIVSKFNFYIYIFIYTEPEARELENPQVTARLRESARHRFAEQLVEEHNRGILLQYGLAKVPKGQLYECVAQAAHQAHRAWRGAGQRRREWSPASRRQLFEEEGLEHED